MVNKLNAEAAAKPEPPASPDEPPAKP